MGAPSEPIHKSTTTQNVAAGGITVGGVLVFLLTLARNYVPQYIPWDADSDASVIAGATAIITPFVSRWISTKRAGAAVVLLCVALASSCAITTPKGTYSLALNGEQIGVLKDVAQQAANIAKEIKDQQVALAEAEKNGNTERAANILQKLAALKEQFAAAKAKAAAKAENDQATVAQAEATVEAAQ